MTRGSIREYTEAIRGRYLRASKKEKGNFWDEFTEVTGYYRKATTRLLRRGNQQSEKQTVERAKGGAGSAGRNVAIFPKIGVEGK